MFRSSNSVIPTGTDHRGGDDLRSGGTLCLMFASDGWRSSRSGRHENANERREDFVQPSNCPTQAKAGLEWAIGRSLSALLCVTTKRTTIGTVRLNEIRLGRGEEPEEPRQAWPQL